MSTLGCTSDWIFSTELMKTTLTDGASAMCISTTDLPMESLLPSIGTSLLPVLKALPVMMISSTMVRRWASRFRTRVSW